MIPFFPALRPPIANRIWFVDSSINEESEVLRYEREHQAWTDSIKNAAADVHPIGRVLTMPGPETDDEDANDDSEDTDSHDDEDDDTNDRTIPGQPERGTFALYSLGDDINLNDSVIGSGAGGGAAGGAGGGATGTNVTPIVNAAPNITANTNNITNATVVTTATTAANAAGAGDVTPLSTNES